MINVLGDALAAGIMAHVCRKDFAQNVAAEVRLPPPSSPATPRPPGGGGQYRAKGTESRASCLRDPMSSSLGSLCAFPAMVECPPQPGLI